MRLLVARFVRDSSMALLALLFCAGFAAPARAATCSAGTLVTVVAHLDDDLLFVDPAISERLDAGWCITTVHLIGGANGADFAYVLTRERASRLVDDRCVDTQRDRRLVGVRRQALGFVVGALWARRADRPRV